MKAKIGDFLKRTNRKVHLIDSDIYKQVTIKCWNKGVVLRREAEGKIIKTKSQFLIKENDFLLSKIDARNGAFGLAPKELNNAIITNTFLSFLIDESLVSKEWFNFYVSSPLFIESCRSASFGTTNRKTLKENVFLGMEVDLPSLEEQKKIALLLNNANSSYSEFNKSSDSLLQDLSDFRKEILNRAFRGELTEQDIADGTGAELLRSIQLERQQQEAETKRKKKTELAPVEAGEEPYDVPESWTWTRLHEVATKLTDGSHNPPKDAGKGYPIISAKNITKNGNIVFGKSNRFVSEVDFVKEDARTSIKSGDLLLCTVGSIGNAAIVRTDIKFTAQRSVSIIDTLISNEYLRYLFVSPFGANYLNENSSGTAQKGIYLNTLSHFEFPLPPLAEQHRIVEKIEAIFAQLDVMEEAIRLQKDEASKCYEEILRKSLEGTPELVTA